MALFNENPLFCLSPLKINRNNMKQCLELQNIRFRLHNFFGQI